MQLLNRTLLLLLFATVSPGLTGLSGQGLSRKEANNKVAELRRLVKELDRDIKVGERKQRRLTDSYESKIAAKDDQIQRLKKLLYGPFLPPSPTPTPSPIPIPPPAPPEPGTTFPDPAPLYAKIKRLEKEVAKLREQNKAQREYIAELESTVAELNNTVDSLGMVIRELNSKYAALEALYKMQEEVLDCLRGMASEKQRLKGEAEKDLVRARDLYALLISSIENPDSAIGRAEEDTLLTNIYTIYKQYGEQTIDTLCGDVRYAYTLEYLKAGDHLILASIFARFPRHLLNEFGEAPDQRAAKLSAVLLKHISAVLEKGNYNQRAQALRLLEILPELLVTGASVDVDDSTGTKIFNAYLQIPQHFRRGEYAKVINEYGKYERYEGDERFQATPEALAAARYCAGMVLLFDLGKVSKSRNLVMPGSFLARRGLSQQRQTGMQLLNDVVNMVPTNDKSFPKNVKKWQIKAAYGLSKNYDHQSSKPIR